MITSEQRSLASKLLSGQITKAKMNELRSNARRYGNLDLSIDLAVAYELYKYCVKSSCDIEGVND